MRPSDTTAIVVITQVQSIAVLFSIPEDHIPQALTLLRNGSTVPVEALGRIDTTTGTTKLKAVFDTRDNALFPNQFVNVRLLLN